MTASHPLTAPLYLLLGRRIRRLRDEQNLTQIELAQAGGISRSSLANLEAGRQYAPVHALLGIADRLGVTVHELIPTPAEMEAARISQERHGLVLREGEVQALEPLAQKTLIGILDQIRQDSSVAPSSRANARKEKRHGRH